MTDEEEKQEAVDWFFAQLTPSECRRMLSFFRSKWATGEENPLPPNTPLHGGKRTDGGPDPEELTMNATAGFVG